MKAALEFLSDLERNNDRAWFHANKVRCQAAHAEFEDFVREMIVAISEFDISIAHCQPKELTFKMMRDTRFSHDKSPYNPKLRAHIASSGKLPIPVGYFISIAPGDRSILGGGLFASMFKDATAMIRDHIAENGDELERILADKDFARLFTVKGDCLKNVPKGYDLASPQSAYLKHKSWYIEFPASDSEVMDTARFVPYAASLFKLMKPFNDFLNAALDGFKMPTR